MKEFLEGRIKEALHRNRGPAVVVKIPDLKSNGEENGSIVQEALPKAVHEVCMLYAGGLLDSLIPPQSTEGIQNEKNSDQSWVKLAEEFPMFRQNIGKLRERLKVVTATKTDKTLPTGIIVVSTAFSFTEVKDRMAQGFLKDILLSRLIEFVGHLDYDLEPWKEAELMASEIGLQEGWKSEQARGVTMEQLMQKVLQGDLRVTHQSRSILLERKDPTEPALVMHFSSLDQWHSQELSTMVWRLGIPRGWLEKLLQKDFDKPKKPRSFTITTDTGEKIEEISQYIAKTPLGDVEVSDCNLYPPATRFKGSFHSEGFEIIYALEGEATLFFQNSTDAASASKDQVKMHVGDLAIIPSPTASGWSFVGEGFKFRYISSPPWRPDLVRSVQ